MNTPGLDVMRRRSWGLVLGAFLISLGGCLAPVYCTVYGVTYRCEANPAAVILSAAIANEQRKLLTEVSETRRVRSTCERYIEDYAPHRRAFVALFDSGGVCTRRDPVLGPRCIAWCGELTRAAVPGSPAEALLRREDQAVADLTGGRGPR